MLHTTTSKTSGLIDTHARPDIGTTHPIGSFRPIDHLSIDLLQDLEADIIDLIKDIVVDIVDRMESHIEEMSMRPHHIRRPIRGSQGHRQTMQDTTQSAVCTNKIDLNTEDPTVASLSLSR